MSKREDATGGPQDRRIVVSRSRHTPSEAKLEKLLEDAREAGYKQGCLQRMKEIEAMVLALQDQLRKQRELRIAAEIQANSLRRELDVHRGKAGWAITTTDNTSPNSCTASEFLARQKRQHIPEE